MADDPRRPSLISPKARRLIDEIIKDDDLRTDRRASTVVSGTLGDFVSSDGTIDGARLPLSDALPPTETFSATGTAGASTDPARGDHQHPMPADPVTAHVAAADPHTGYVLESLILAKGDLLVGTGSGSLARLAAPLVEGFHLISDPAATTGLAWEPSPIGVTLNVLDGLDNVIAGTDEVVVS